MQWSALFLLCPPCLPQWFHYTNLPSQAEYEFGWSRGRPGHNIARYQERRGNAVRAKVVSARTWS